MPAMRPRVSTEGGEVIMPEMAILLVPEEPMASTAFFTYQVQKSNEQDEVREAGLRYMGADYFQIPEMFSDEMTAVFAAGSSFAAALLQSKTVVLDFQQYAQAFRLRCKARRLRPQEPAHASSYWQARLFNAKLPATVQVLAFKPDWKSALADPSL